MLIEPTDQYSERSERRGSALVGVDVGRRRIVLDRRIVVVDVGAGAAVHARGNVGESEEGAMRPLGERTAVRFRVAD